MSRPITIILEAADVLQILDALENRAECYEKTAVLMNGEYKTEMDSEYALDQFFIPEECRDATEAEDIGRHFRDIITSLEKQLGESS
ncbi:MAG: hypothetical protein WBV94_32235 [Blastocatellia bacterium]